MDGNANTYWESANNAFPQSLTVDLGQNRSISRVVLKLPPGWEARSQTIAVSGSADGTAYNILRAAAVYPFAPNATITFPATTQRHLRLTFTGNTGWPAGQVSEFEVYPS